MFHLRLVVLVGMILTGWYILATRALFFFVFLSSSSSSCFLFLHFIHAVMDKTGGYCAECEEKSDSLFVLINGTVVKRRGGDVETEEELSSLPRGWDEGVREDVDRVHEVRLTVLYITLFIYGVKWRFFFIQRV